MLFTEYELWQKSELDLFNLTDVPEFLYNEAIDGGSRYLENNWEVLTASMYTKLHSSEYHDGCVKRRLALSSLSLAEHVEKKGRFIEEIINGIWCICEESTWSLPDGSANLKDVQAPRFDINSARTASLLALSTHLFRKELPVSVKKRVLYEVRKRVLNQFSDARQLTPENCAHALIAAMFAEPEEEKRRLFVDKTLAVLDIFLEEFTNGGYKASSEQSLYKRSAFVFDILEILYNVTDQKLSVYSDENVKLVAESIYKAHIGNEGFSEISEEPDGARIYLFGKRMDYKKLTDFGASEFLKIKEKTLPDSYNLFHKLYSLKYAAKIISYGDNFDEQESGYFDSMDLFVKKTKYFSAAIKGGASAAGNFMVYLDNKPYCVDLEKSHNLPIVNGFTQFSNTKNAVCEKTDNGLIIDISRTYPRDAGIVKWIRRIEAEEKYVIISDEYELEKFDDIRIIMIMKEKPILSEDRILIGDGSIVWDGNLALRVELVKSKNYDYVYRLVFHVKDDSTKGTVRMALKK